MGGSSELMENAFAGLAALSALFSAVAAIASWALAKRARDDAKADEVLMPGPLQHPNLREFDHRRRVLIGAVFNKSQKKAAITDVRLFDSSGVQLQAEWSSNIDEFGNPVGKVNPLSVTDSVQLCVCRTDGNGIPLSAHVEVHHTFPNSPLRMDYKEPRGWEGWMAGGAGPSA